MIEKQTLMDSTDHDVLVRMEARLGNIERRFEEFVTKVEFIPVRAIAFGLVGLLCSSIVLAVVALVLTAKK